MTVRLSEKSAVSSEPATSNEMGLNPLEEIQAQQVSFESEAVRPPTGKTRTSRNSTYRQWDRRHRPSYRAAE